MSFLLATYLDWAATKVNRDLRPKSRNKGLILGWIAVWITSNLQFSYICATAQKP